MKKTFAILLALVMMLSMSAMAASITITPPTNGNGTDSGITYTAYKIFDATISGDAVAYSIESTSPYYTTISNSEYFTLTQSAGSETTYLVEAKDTFTAEVANTFADTLKAVSATAAGTLTKRADGNYKLEGLANGYYLITSSVGSDLILETIGDVTAATKNEYPTLDKTVEDDTAYKGQILTFTIKVDIPEDAVDEIVVHDNMTGLEYQSMTAVDGITATTGLDDGCEVHFTLTADYVAAHKDTKITITYTAKVVADVANNEAWLVDDTFTSNPDTDNNVYAIDLVVNKVDGTDNTKTLSDAKFVLKNAEGKFYQVDDDGYVSWVDTQDAATVLTTGDDGKVEFTDIEEGTYYLIETEAPAGYNLLTAPVEVEVTKTIEEDVAVDVETTIENNTGSQLPTTGGMGTTIFYVVGGLMVAAAVVALVAKKKVSAK